MGLRQDHMLFVPKTSCCSAKKTVDKIELMSCTRDFKITSQKVWQCVMQTKGEVLGRLRGVSVKMLMHHSRNSEQKQWDETLVLALSGMGRLLRAHLPLLVPMQAFPQVQ